MGKSKPEAGRQCPNCGQTQQQIKIGYNRSGTQRCRCKACGTRYTLEPKRREYPEETRALAIQMYHDGSSGREVGRALGMSKANVYNWLKRQGKE